MPKGLIKIALGLLITLLLSGTAFAQLSGIKYIVSGVSTPDTFPSFFAAISALNSQGVGTGGVTFRVPAGQTFTENPNPPPITATGTASNPITFVKWGAGANPVVIPGVAGTLTVTAVTGSTSNGDAIIKIVGGDYITFDGIDVHDNPAFVGNGPCFDIGYFLVRVSGTDACQNVTIRNSRITLKQTTQYGSGIYIALLDNAGAVPTVTATTGRMENIFIYNNIIDSCYHGIKQNGYADVVGNAFAFYDLNIEIGVAGPNLITNLGGGANVVYGIYAGYANNLKINNNIINGSSTTGAIYGIYVTYCYNANVDICYNDIRLQSSGTTNVMYGIYNYGGYANTSGVVQNTVRVVGNLIHDFDYPTATTATIYGIYNYPYYARTVYVDSNTVRDISLAGTGTFYGIYSPYDSIKYFRWNTVRKVLRSASATSGTMYLTYPYYSYKQVVIANNVIDSCGNLNLLNTGTIYVMYAYNYYATQAEFYNNQMTNIFAGSGTTYGLYASFAYANPANCYNNFVKNIQKGYGTLYGLYFYNYYGTNANFYNNQVRNLAATSYNGAGTIYATYVYGPNAGAINIYNNVIDSVRSLGSVYGMYQYYGAPANIYNNYIANLRTDSTTYFVDGLYLGYASQGNVYNNMIANLEAPRATGLTAAVGIYIGGGVSWGLYYNSVSLNATSTYGTTFGTAALYASTSPVVELKNNIFKNTSTPGATGGYTVAYYRSSTDLSTYASGSNNNCFYAGTPSTYRAIYYDGTNADTLFTAYQTRVAPRDGASFTENVPFLSATNLHINPTIPTMVESGAIPITSPIPITTDFDYQTRNTSTPDVGADEGNFTPLDLAGPVITYTPLRHSNVTSARTITATITDATGVDTLPARRPRLWYRTGTSLPLVGSYTAVVGVRVSGNDWSFTIPGQSLGTWVEYYIAAQDSVVPPNVSTNPAGGGGTTPPGSIPPAQGYIYAVRDPLDFTVGASGADFTSITQGINILSVGIDANCRLLLQANYTSANEVFPITIGLIPGCNDVFSATDDGGQPRDQKTWCAPFDKDTRLEPLKPEQCIPGLGEIDATTDLPKTLTIKPDSAVTCTIHGSAFTIFRLQGARNVIIDGSNTEGGTTRDLWIINDTTTALSYAVLILGATGAPANYNQIKNCNLRCGVPNYLTWQSRTFGQWGVSLAQPDTGTVFKNNDVSDWRYFGFYMQNVIGATIEDNYFHDVDAQASIDYYGCWLASGTKNTEFRRNTIANLTHQVNFWWIIAALYCSPTATSNNKIYNNFFYNILDGGYGSSTNYGRAIYVYNDTGGVYAYNSVYMYGDDPSTSTSSYHCCFYTSSYCVNLVVKDNIFYNEVVPAAGNAYCYYIGSTPVNLQSDYNDLYAPEYNGYVGYWVGTNYQTLANWQTGTGLDLNSISADPGFVDYNDLHIDHTYDVVNRRGTPIAGITTDFDGDTRHPTRPDIGADEYALEAPEAPLLIAPANNATEQPLDGQLIWNRAEGATHYDVYLDVVTPPVTKVSGFQTDTFYNYSGLEINKTYYWQVVAINDTVPMDATTPSEIWSFTTISLRPTLIAPAHNSIIFDQTPDFIWHSVNLANVYKLEVDTTNSFAAPLIEVGLIETTYTPTTNLPYAHYYWRVKAAIDSTVTWGAYSSVFEFTIQSPVTPGWQTMASIPTQNSGKSPKSGSCMAGSEATGKIYFLKASNTQDFHIYTIELTGQGSWTTESMPLGTKPKDGKKPKKGASMAAYGDYIYVLRGNNTPGFWRYKVTAPTGWETLPPIPAGTKLPKDGSGMVAVTKGGNPYLFVMKGSKTSEFYLYDLTNNTWSSALTAPPTGPSGKAGYKKGSCLAYDGGDWVYVMKGQYGDFYRYNLNTESWDSLTRYDHKTYLNRENKKKKIGEGAGLVYHNDYIYLLKGGNTNEFWKYGPLGGTRDWTQMDSLWDIPTGGGKRVKGGGALIKFTNFFWASKGNNTGEFYRHGLPTDLPVIALPTPTNEGTMGSKVNINEFNLTIAPNPAINLTAIRYTLPVAGPVNFKLYDVTGAVVKTYTNSTPTKDGVLLLDTKTLPSGVYILRFNSGDIRVTRKLVLEK